jgi:hypothetical protein
LQVDLPDEAAVDDFFESFHDWLLGSWSRIGPHRALAGRTRQVGGGLDQGRSALSDVR